MDDNFHISKIEWIRGMQKQPNRDIINYILCIPFSEIGMASYKCTWWGPCKL